MRVCVVGAGTRFLSGISYYTIRSANALARSHNVSVILMRQLLPTFLYPGRKRVGSQLTELNYDPSVRVFDGVDWFWLPSMIQALVFLIRNRPDVMVLQWWTGTVLHSYLLLALVGRLLGARVVVEFHEVLDTAELRLALAHTYVRTAAPLLMRLASGFVIHSEFDRPLLESTYRLGTRPVELIPHGPYDHHKQSHPSARFREAPDGCRNLLFFGVIRPYKGLEDLIQAFDAIPEDEIGNYWLTIVGELWEGWTLPLELIEQCRYRNRITFVNRYVRDDEVAGFFNGADVVVLPYLRSSASGPLHIAMSHGLPVVLTRVGGLVEAVAGYEGVILVPPRDPAALRAALAEALPMCEQRYEDPHSWEANTGRYTGLFHSVMTKADSAERVSV